MNLKIPLRVGRILVVLALIVALLGSSIPVPARAVGFVPGLYDIAANIGVNAALRAIGVGPGNSPDAFNQLVTDATNNLFDVLSPLTQVFLDYTENGFRAFLSADFLARILTFLFSSGSLKDNSVSLTNSAQFTLGSYSYSVSTSAIGSGPDSAYFVIGSGSYYNSGGYPKVYSAYILSSANLSYSYSRDGGSWQSGNLTSAKYTNGYAAQIGFSSASNPVSSGIPVVDVGKHESYNSFINALLAAVVGTSGVNISTEKDLVLDSVGNSLSAPPYSGWISGAITQENQSFVPVSIPSISDSTAISTQTQAQAQAGTVPDSVADEIIAGSDVVPETGTIADVITAVRALGADIVAAIQAVPAAIADVFSPPAISDEYMISLSDFFPFCLPFDIYDLLSALAADPQAPVFEWTIAVPRWGISHDIEIDLSEWDDIARLFRTFELAAFVVGLALITRQKFLRS